ncbi:MAG TPA: hypothetical protein VJ742_01125 [Nitrososphaera sp.]|nr:hypothetical protein [Nitrososphaera sp.]
MVLTYDGYVEAIQTQKSIEAELNVIRARLDNYERNDKKAGDWYKAQTQ